MPDLLYRWPPAAKVERRVPKEKFFEHGALHTTVRRKFIDEIARITWAYKLATSTINLVDSPEVPEIQVFELAAKGDDVSDQVLAAIDKAIPKPIVFEITSNLEDERQTRMAACFKRISTGSGRTKAEPAVNRYFSTGWLHANTERQSLPTAITLPSLYVSLLEPLTSIGVRPGEGLSKVGDRLKLVITLEREICSLENNLRKEKQLNRKIDLRRTLKAKQTQLKQQRESHG